MTDTIYLLTSDGHRDSLILEHYCTSEKTIIEAIKYYYKEEFDQETKDFEINFNKEEVDFKYLDTSWPDDWEQSTFYFRTIKKFKTR